MRIPFKRRHATRHCTQTRTRASTSSTTSQSLIIIALAAATASIPVASAISFQQAPDPNLDLSNLGRIGIAGDFSGLSLFQYEAQNERPFSTNGSESLFAQLPNGLFASVVQADASITAMCSFLAGGKMQGVVLAGNFTGLGGQPTTAMALLNTDTAAITPLSGLSGQVNAVYCDTERNLVYVGGNFKGGNSTNAISWVAGDGWTNLPFAGFNGPVTSITKASSGNIIFGGSFTGLGNVSTPTEPDEQVINLSTASLKTTGASTSADFSDPKNIVCKTTGQDGAGNTFLLADNTPGSWQANLGFGFRPTKLRLYNTRQDGRSTKTWRYTALPDGGIMNFTYVDPASGANHSCTSECPLSNDATVLYQDFFFVNNVGMDGFRLDVSAWYGNGGGFDGIELFQNEIYAYAVNDFNEPTCAGISTASSATKTGPWSVAPQGTGQSQYLTAQVLAPVSSNATTVEFTADVRESGFYVVNMFTPGCTQDGSCGTRGQIKISGTMAQGRGDNATINTSIYQTNAFDKYDQIYFGYVDATTSSFKPTVTLAPLPGQALSNQTVVAQRVGFTQYNTTGGLNGLFEFNPAVAGPINATSFASSTFDTLGSNFTAMSGVNALITSGDITYIGGNFTSGSIRNIVSVNSKTSAVQMLDSGLNGHVNSLYLNGSSLYVGGQFSNTQGNGVTGLNNVAVFDTSKNTWGPLGGGVDGPVRTVVPLLLNVTSTTPELTIGLTGDFKQLNAFGSNKVVAVTGLAIWVPSQNNWLENLSIQVQGINGILTSSILDVPGGAPLYAGSLTSSGISTSGAVSLTGSTSLSMLPGKIQASTSSNSTSQKRDVEAESSLQGVITGAFYNNGGRNVTILAGHFSASGSNGSTISNVLFINGSNNDALSGFATSISADSTFVTVAVQGDTLWAGGKVSGNVNGADVKGLVTYNMITSDFQSQPPTLNGGTNLVSSIQVRTGTSDVYVGGTFQSAGSLGCPGVCYFSASSSQWNRPGTGLAGGVESLLWTTSNSLVAGGNLTVNNNATYLAQYDATSQTWSAFPGSSILPGPVQILSAGSLDGSQLWVSGTVLANSSTYLMKYDGTNWNTAGSTLDPGTIIQSVQIFTLTADHDSTPLIDGSHALLLTGRIQIPGSGSASAALFNGTTFTPYGLTSNTGNQAGMISRIFTENSDGFFTSSSHHLPLFAVVLIALAIALGCIFLLVLAGLLLDRLRKRREGYMPAPTSMIDRGSGLQRIPPHELLESLGKEGPGGAPRL